MQDSQEPEGENYGKLWEIWDDLYDEGKFVKWKTILDLEP